MSSEDEVRAILLDYVNFPPQLRQRGPNQLESPFDFVALRKMSGAEGSWSEIEWAALHPEESESASFIPMTCEGVSIPDVEWYPERDRLGNPNFNEAQLAELDTFANEYDSMSEADRKARITKLLLPDGLFANLGPEGPERRETLQRAVRYRRNRAEAEEDDTAGLHAGQPEEKSK
jgi:hypothetical protein